MARRNGPTLDLRVDDHADPLAELERLEQVSRERWVHFRQFLPTRRIRPGSPTAPSSTPASKPRIASADDDGERR